MIYSNGSQIGGQILPAVPPSGADLASVKQTELLLFNPNDPVSYTIQVSNSGPEAVTNATVSDTISTKLDNAAWTCSASSGASCTASGTGNINDLVNLPVGGYVTYTLTADVSSSAAGNLINTANVSTPGGITDPILSNNTAEDIDVIDGGGGGTCEDDPDSGGLLANGRRQRNRSD